MTILRTMFGELSPWGRFWLYLGLASLTAAAGMSFMVGWKMTALHAVFLACLSFVTAFLPEAAYRAWQDGKRGVAVILGLCSLPLFAVEFGQHAAYTAGIRGHEIAEARVQNTKYDGAQDTVAENKTQLAFWQKRLETLTTQNGWTATVTADGLRAELAAIEGDQVFKRSKQCADVTRPDSRAFCDKRAQVQARIATLEETKDLSDKIAHAKTMLAGIRDKAANVEHKSSQTEHMNKFLSKAVALLGSGDLKVSEKTEEGTQLSANLAIALAGTGLPALALFVAGLYRVKRKDEDVTAHQRTTDAKGNTTIIVEKSKDNDALKAQIAAFTRTINARLA